MRNLVLLIVLVAGGISGYFIGSYRGNAAIEALDAAKQAAKQEKAESDKTINELKESMAGLASEHKEELEKVESDYKQQRAILDDALAGKEKKLKELAAKMERNQRQIERLRNSVATTTNPADKQNLLGRIAQLEHDNSTLKSGVDGLKCLSATIPDEILRQLQGGRP